MKNILLLLVCSITSVSATAQLKSTAVCPPFTIDIIAGTVNDLYAKSAIGEIQERLPCFSEMAEKDIDSKCAGVFYKDKDILFYTDRRYIEIGEKFKGKIVPAMLGVNRNSLFAILGHPKLKDTNWEAYQMGYGTMVLYYNKAGKINKIQISSKTTETLKLCE